MKSQKTLQMVRIALFGGILCVLSPFTIPVPMSPVPLSLATFVVYLAGVLLGARQGAVCVLIYLLLGMVGLPVFSGFSGGIGVLFGPTGGYLVGYVPCALLIGWLAHGKLQKGNMIRKLLAMLLGTLLCYFFGTIWFLIVMKGNFSVGQTLLLCVVPYVPLDMIKIFAAHLCIRSFQERTWFDR